MLNVCEDCVCENCHSLNRCLIWGENEQATVGFVWVGIDMTPVCKNPVELYIIESVESPDWI